MKLLLDEGNRLFDELEKNPPDWWKLLVNDKDIYIDVRKGNYIDIYYNGGALLRELKHDGKKFKGNTNYKYLLRAKSEYVDYSITNDLFGPSTNHIELLTFKNLDSKILERIKANISTHYPANSEKGIQARFIKNAKAFIDSEFAYNYENIKLRIDLVWIDKRNKKILFVELKTMGDSRLFTDEINEQLSKYFHFATKYEVELLDYYQKVFRIKKALKILPSELQELESLNDYKVEKKPLLLLGDCNQKCIDIKADFINKNISKVAVGAYYFGGTKPNCDIIKVGQKGNRYVFKQ